MGLPVMDEYSIFQTDSEVVAEAKKVLLEYEKAEKTQSN